MALRLKGGAGGEEKATIEDLDTGDHGVVAALKVARVVLSNLYNKGDQDPKFRRLRTGNPKVQARLLSQPVVVDFLLECGFVRTEHELVYNESIDVAATKAQHDRVESILRNSSPLQEMQPKPAPQPTASMIPRTSSARDTTVGKRSIKAQMMEKREREAKEKRAQEKRRRAQLLKGFEHDKAARRQPGWTAKISSANKGAQPSAQANF